MRTPVKISIQDQDGNRSTEAHGIYMEKNGTHYLFYESKTDGKCRITVSADTARIMRAEGTVKDMKITLGVEEPFSVRTPVGMLDLAVKGRQIKINLTEKFKHFSLSYDLMDRGEIAAHQDVRIDAETENSCGHA